MKKRDPGVSGSFSKPSELVGYKTVAGTAYGSAACSLGAVTRAALVLERDRGTECMAT